ncbi:MAG: RNA polymerase sigma factor [Flammeovirgaceae bacterium]|nr:RNA polymerase sigma factor [Flammeovirgaceae bacterium]
MVIEKCILGDRRAQYQVYEMYSKAMFNICIRIINNLEEAEDVLQEAFVSAFRNIKSFKGEGTFGSWLKKIVINHAINHLRKKKLQFVDIDNIADGAANNISDEGKFDEKEIFLEVGKIKKAIKLLPDGYRIVFSLYLLEGYDHKEISEILNISESTSKSQFNRAKKKLKEIMLDNE